MTRNRLFTITLVGIAALFFPMIFQDSYTRHLAILALIFAVIVSNWDLSLGFAGLFNFGHTTFFGVGVYTAAILAKTFEVNPWLAMIAGGLSAAVVAVIIAAPVAKLKGIYVVLVTFAFSQLALQLVLSQGQITGGAEGMVRIPSLRIGDYNFARDFKLGYYYTALGLTAISTTFLLLVARSPFGKSLRAVRDNEDYATARGISVARQRILVLVVSAIFTGIAGGFYAVYLRVASPEVFGFATLSLALSMVLIGGTGTIIGPIFAALVLTFVSEGMAGIRGFEEARFIVIAVTMIAILRIAPGGAIDLMSKAVSIGRPPPTDLKSKNT
ncbi:branched-chain amino acid ABC transporter permease [Pacificibacter sp. AS14]|uniref:branched-chain amino acid ABC transporter permease n=1 Tax=Pacificibacter sp. AS14 TaxID=3135785 RepID=UPI00317D46A8